jgi:hypothetical protein
MEKERGREKRGGRMEKERGREKREEGRGEGGRRGCDCP